MNEETENVAPLDAEHQSDTELLIDALESMQMTNETLLDTNNELKEANQALLEKLNEVVTGNSQVSAQLDISNLTTNELLQNIYTETSLTTGTVQAYGLIVVPFILLCVMLWWFFKQFLYRY